MKPFLFVSLLFAAGCAANADRSEIFKTDGTAIHGYDAVAFHTEGKPVKGAETLTYKWKDVDWRFASQAHLDSFKNAPERYAPQYGGWCAYGTAEGHKAPTETDTWTVREGKLYFNYNNEVKQLWNKDQEGLIKKADANWERIKFDK